MSDRLHAVVGVMPERIRLKKDWPWFVEFRHPWNQDPQVETLKAGEIGNRFDHTQCYTFQSRNGWTPSIPCAVLLRLPHWWSDANKDICGERSESVEWSG